MGILNVTPDSFSDGGKFYAPKAAIDHGLYLADSGADIIDLGGESTRPGALPIAAEEQWERIAPVLTALAKALGPRISIDCRDEGLIARALEHGVSYVNNVDGLCSKDLLQKMAKMSHFRGYIAMHKQGSPQDMQQNPLKGREAVESVLSFFKESTARLKEAGLREDQIFLDPGIGFGKDEKANLSLLYASAKLAKKYQLCLGISRKSFIGRLLDIEAVEDRDDVSKCVELALAFSGVAMIRTHEVKKLDRIRKLFC